jgi:outer membrane protein assembly factor BamD
MKRVINDSRISVLSVLSLARNTIVLSVALVVAACASGPKRPPTGTPEPDKFLFERGTEALDKRKWLTAREYFRELSDTYPQTTYRADAKLGIADTYLGEGTAESYVLALNEYREFLAFYPTHKRADYAQYKLGMTHFYQMHGPDRDQTQTKEAIRELATFVQRYPNSPLIEEGKQQLRAAQDRLSRHEYGVGYTYYRARWCPGAVSRFTAILENDPQYTYRDAVYFYLAECYMQAQQPAQALPYYDKLMKEFEQSEFLERARKRADEIKADQAAKIKQSVQGVQGSRVHEVH